MQQVILEEINMKRILFVVFCALSLNVIGQIGNYNQFPTMRPFHILDDKLDDISFAYGLRVLESDYNGPLIRLRRDSDNAEEDFGWADNDIVDVDAINTWRAGANVFVVIWYDQSGLGRNAIQNNVNRQPQFTPNAAHPFFRGDGANDFLDTQTSIQVVTNAGNNGSVFGVFNATRRSQHTFGVLRGSNRWSTHVNWNNGNLYFDPGICCASRRTYGNAAFEGVWTQYSFVKLNTNTLAKRNGVTQYSGFYNRGRCTINDNFTLCWARGNQSLYSNTAFTEMIMYRTDISTADIEEIEQDQISFWSL